MSNPMDEQTFDSPHGEDPADPRVVRNGNPGRPQHEFDQPVPPEGDYPPEPARSGSDPDPD